MNFKSFNVKISYFFILAMMLVVTSFQLEAAGVVAMRQTELRLFPDESSQSVGNLDQGQAARTLQESGDWTLIEVSKGVSSVKGWVKTSSLGMPLESSANQPQNTKSNFATDGERYNFSLAFNPITIFFPWVELQFGVPVHPHVRLNVVPTLMTWAYGDDPFDGAVFGGTISATSYFDPWRGWYLEPGVLFMKPSGSAGFWVGGQMIGGYENTWPSGLFINFGLGVMLGYFNDGSSSEDDWFDMSGVYPLPTANMLLGYRFK